MQEDCPLSLPSLPEVGKTFCFTLTHVHLPPHPPPCTHIDPHIPPTHHTTHIDPHIWAIYHPHTSCLQQIGWRRLFSSSHDLEMSKVVKCANVLYPAGFFVILVYTCVSQLLTCFFRTDVRAAPSLVDL